MESQYIGSKVLKGLNILSFKWWYNSLKNISIFCEFFLSSFLPTFFFKQDIKKRYKNKYLTSILQQH